MTGRCGTLTRVVVAALALSGAAVCARAQSTWGWADIYYDPVYDWIGAIGITWPDYSTDYYYDPKVDLFLLGTNGFYDQYYCTFQTPCDEGDHAWAGLTAPAQPGVMYTVYANHKVDVYFYHYQIDPYCSYGCYDWYDAYGYSFDQCTPGCQSDPQCWCVDIISTSPGKIWYPPLFTVLLWMALADLGWNEESVTLPMPVLEVRKDGVLITDGHTVHLTEGSAFSPPQMPALTARLLGPPLGGTTTWKITTQYTGHGRNDSDTYPSAGGAVLPSSSTWDIRAAFGSYVRGGTATITYRYNTSPESAFTFQIRGTNPSEANAKTRLGSSPWFLTRIARQESGIRQFNGNDPLFGAPNGWGMMQLDPPPGPQEIWSWWANVDAGKVRLNQKNGELTPRWNERVEDWTTWNRDNPNQQVAPPAPRQEGNCLFVWANGGSGSESEKSFRDACWIKRYNGLGVQPARDFLIWQNTGVYEQDPRWEYYPSATLPDGRIVYYVQTICNQAP